MRDTLLEIPNSDPFKNDQFDREIIAKNFMKIFEQDQDGIVLSIDSDWGTGKTTFIKMWESMVNNHDNYKDKYETLYFNAWDSDYMEDPLLAILAEIKLDIDKGKFKKGLEVVYKNGKKIAKPLISFIGKAATSGILNLDNVDFGDDVEKYLPELAGKISDSLVSDAVKSRASRELFKANIQEFQEKSDRKIIFFIDELDRCRPKFAIELLENIKHLFSMRGVIFVIALDKEQLAHSVATIYGQNMDTTGYLRRFFDLDYKLANPDKIKYAEIKGRDIFEKYENSKYFEQFLHAFILADNFSLRDIDKLYYYIKFSIPTIDDFKVNNNSIRSIIKSYLYAYLISLKVKKPILYKKIMNMDYENDIETIRNEFELNKIVNMALNIKNLGPITNNKILDVIKSKAIEKYLILNSISKTSPSTIRNNENKDYLISIEGYDMNYNMSNLFEYNGECTIKSNLEFINSVNYDF